VAGRPESKAGGVNYLPAIVRAKGTTMLRTAAVPKKKMSTDVPHAIVSNIVMGTEESTS
jgi:hypothetical protein